MVRFTLWLSRVFLGRQYQESSFRVARAKDTRDTRCVCGDPACHLLWHDGGRPQVWEKPHGAGTG